MGSTPALPTRLCPCAGVDPFPGRALVVPLGSIMQPAATPRSAAQRPGSSPGRAVLAEFLAKLLRLAALRLSDLCDRLSFSPLDKSDILTQAGPPPRP